MDEVCHLIEGKLLDMGHEPRSVQVVVQETNKKGTDSGDDVRVFMVDKKGVIAKRVLNMCKQNDSEPSKEKSKTSGTVLREEVRALREKVTELAEQLKVEK